MNTVSPALVAHVQRWFGDKIEAPTGTELAKALEEAPELESLGRLVRFAEDAYVRVPLYHSERFELRLLCWRPGQSSALHCHGSSACAFRVLAGEATEQRADGELKRLRPGQIAVAGDGLVHQVANLGDEALVTLHVYAPPLPVEQPSSASGRQIVIIGGGFCGTALAVQLLETRDPALRITLVEASPRVGRGVAFGTSREEHLLNVPASKMSLDPRRPNDFLEYARARLPKVHSQALVSRGLVGDYLQDRLARAISRSPAKLRLAQASVESIRPEGEGWRVLLSDGRRLEANQVVLATGHGPPVLPAPFDTVSQHPHLIADPWAPGALDRVQRGDRVLLLGTGLSAVDVLLTLSKTGVEGPITAVSRHGRWPRPHLPTISWHGPKIELPIEDAPATAEGLARWLGEQIGSAANQKVPWQAVIGGLRPHTAKLWERLPQEERAIFLREHRSMWDTLRHRMPQSSWEALRTWRSRGWLNTRVGGVLKVEPYSKGFYVTFLDAPTHTPLRFDRVIVCAGQESDPRRFGTPLWRDLIARHLVTPDPLGLGLLTDERGATLGPEGRPTGLWALGGLQRPRWFESTAVPELSRQVEALVRALVPAKPLLERVPLWMERPLHPHLQG